MSAAVAEASTPGDLPSTPADPPSIPPADPLSTPADPPSRPADPPSIPRDSPPSAAGRPSSSPDESLPGPRLLRGAPIAADIRAGVVADVQDFKRRYGYPPTLAIVLVGRDAPSTVYLQQILKGCHSAGIDGRLVEMPGRVSAAQLRARIRELNDDPLVAGIIVQMPLPRRIPLRSVIDTLDPAKDIDGIHPFNAGLMTLGYEGFLPATAQAAVELIKRSGIPIDGRRAVVVGRSNVVGKPAAILLLREHASVTVLHSHTPDLAVHLREADIVIVAVGRAGLITGDMLRPGATVVDVGINVVRDVAGTDRIVGDVDFASAKDVVSAITPVPGGVGPLTNALLLSHLMRAANDQAQRDRVGRRSGRATARPEHRAAAGA